MLFRGAAEDDHRVLAAPLVYSKEEVNLHPYFLPLRQDRTVQDFRSQAQILRLGMWRGGMCRAQSR
jgi:hypothetical protein